MAESKESSEADGLNRYRHLSAAKSTFDSRRAAISVAAAAVAGIAATFAVVRSWSDNLLLMCSSLLAVWAAFVVQAVQVRLDYSAAKTTFSVVITLAVHDVSRTILDRWTGAPLTRGTLQLAEVRDGMSDRVIASCPISLKSFASNLEFEYSATIKGSMPLTDDSKLVLDFVPKHDDWKLTYRAFYESDDMHEAVDDIREYLEKKGSDARPTVLVASPGLTDTAKSMREGFGFPAMLVEHHAHSSGAGLPATVPQLWDAVSFGQVSISGLSTIVRVFQPGQYRPEYLIKGEWISGANGAYYGSRLGQYFFRAELSSELSLSSRADGTSSLM